MQCIDNASIVEKLNISQSFAKGAMTNDLAVPVPIRVRNDPYNMNCNKVALFSFRKVEEMPGFVASYAFNHDDVNNTSYIVPHTAPERDSVTLIIGGVSYVATQRVLARVIFDAAGVRVRGLRAQMRRDRPTLGTGLWFCDVAPDDAPKLLQLNHCALMHHDRITLYRSGADKVLRAWTEARDKYCDEQKLTAGRPTHPLVIELGNPTRVRGGRNNRRC